MFRRTVPVEERLTIRSERLGHWHVVRLSGELDTDTAAELDDELRRVEASAAREIIVDLSGLRSIGRDGLKVFIQASARSRTDGDRLMLMRGPDPVHAMFEMTGLESRLPFADANGGDVRSLLRTRLARSNRIATGRPARGRAISCTPAAGRGA